MSKNTITIIFCLLMPALLIAQDCKQKFEEANNAYFNGKFELVDELIHECLNVDLDKSSRLALLHLAIRNSLMLSNTTKADEYMKSLLELDPYFIPGDFDPILFRKIFESYEIEPVLSYGGTLGMNIPNIVILRSQSYSSETNEPSNYQTFSTPLIGITAWWKQFGKLYISAGLLYQSTKFYQEEIILGYQLVSSSEQINYLNIPIQIRTQTTKRKLNPYLSAGVSCHYLLAANADINHFSIDTDFALPYPGLPESTVNYNMNKLREKLTLNYIASLGIITEPAPGYSLEFGLNYEYGLKNITNADMRLSDKNLLTRYAYVSDDFTANNLSFTMSIRKDIDKPMKRK